jgi:hypothetical protein
MSVKWLGVQNLKQNQDLLSAVNSLSIKTKFDLAGVSDENVNRAANTAREKFSAFLTNLKGVVAEIQAGEESALLGADLGWRQLAKRLLRSNSFRTLTPSSAEQMLERTMRLLMPENRRDSEELVSRLEEFRVLLEEQTRTDAERVLNDV